MGRNPTARKRPASDDAGGDARELVCVITGKDDALVNARCREFLDTLLEPSQRATALLDAEAASVPASDVLDELRTAPFLADKRVVVLRGADDFISQNRTLLEKYFDQPCSTGRLVLTVRTWDSRTRLAKALPKVGRLISVLPPSRRELPHRLADYAAEAHDKKLSMSAAALLIELAGDDLMRLYSEIDKLVLFADAEKLITPKHIEALTGHNRLFNAFAVIDAMIAGKPGQAVERLRGMFAQDRSAEYTAVGAFAFHLRRMFNAKVLLEKGIGPREVTSRLRIWGDTNGFFSQLRKLSLRQIGTYLQQLAETDYAIKTGRTKTPVAMEQFVISLAAW
ncbi:MAG: DNA polymerase III subunit delta [Phycisphaerales bacterium]|nr:MAG: DNA polymerase III subunit delta [Phycisphaerales bacterium]